MTNSQNHAEAGTESLEPTLAVEMSAGSGLESGRRGWRSRSRGGMRASTMMLTAVWIAVLALYLAVRPGG